MLDTNPKQAQQIITDLINSTFSGYTVAEHEMRAFAKAVFIKAFGKRQLTNRNLIETAFAQEANDVFGIEV